MSRNFYIFMFFRNRGAILPCNRDSAVDLVPCQAEIPSLCKSLGSVVVK